MVRRLAVLAVLALAIAPAVVQAANETRKRTPAVFTDVPCTVVVDRSQNPVFHIDYGIANEDPLPGTMRTADELPDTRTMQFFAFAKQRYDFTPPLWINMSDVERALENGDIVEGEVTPEDVLETSSEWPAGTWVKITPDDPRLPITNAQAAMGVDWDTTGIAPGTWVVGVYTWEPKKNIWSWRFGAIRVVDDTAHADDAGPLGFLVDDIAPITSGVPRPVEGCLDAKPGATFAAAWGLANGTVEPDWVTFADDVAVEDGPFEIDACAEFDQATTLKFRLEVADADGASYVAFSPQFVSALPGDASCPKESDTGCGCNQDRRGALALLPMIAVLVRRRRRYQSTFSPHSSMREPS